MQGFGQNSPSGGLDLQFFGREAPSMAPKAPFSENLAIFGNCFFFVQFPAKLFVKSVIKSENRGIWSFSGAEGAGKFC